MEAADGLSLFIKVTMVVGRGEMESNDIRRFRSSFGAGRVGLDDFRAGGW